MSLKTLLFPPKPIYFFREISVPQLIPGQIMIYDEETTLRNFRKFTPYTNIQMVNTSQCIVEFLLDYNPSRKLIVLGGGTKALRNQPFYSFSIRNTDTTITILAGEVFIELETIR